MRNDSAKLQVRLWKYKSNPVLKDTDFDGLEDGFGYEIKNGIEVPVALNIPYDKRPKDNYFTGRMHTTRMTGNDAIKVDMNMDYRYFFLSNKMYYDELSTMSLLYANSIYRKGSGQSMHSGLQLRSANNLININNGKLLYSKEEIDNISIDSFNNLQVKEMMEHFGFKDVKTYYMGEPGGEGDENKEYFYDKFSVKEDEIVKVRIPESEEDKNYKGIGKKYNNIDEIYLGYKDTHKGRVAIGYKNIEYHGLDKTVIGIVIRGTAEDDDWDSDFDMGDIRIKELIDKNGRKDYFGYDGDLQKLGYDMQYREELNHFIDGYDDWTHTYHHAGFDIVANRILEVLENYIKNYNGKFGRERCFWITGHSMGAGVANLVSAYILNGYGVYGGNRDNVYCYTYAAPNTYYLTDKDEEADYPNATKYRCIFNVVNDDDFVPKLPMEKCEWTKYGRVAEYSIENKDKNIYSRRQSNSENTLYMDGDYRKYIANMYQSNNYEMNSLINELSNIYLHTTQMRKCTYSFDRNGEKIEAKKVSIDNILNTNKNARPYQRISRYKKNIDIPFINKNIDIDLPLEAGVANVQSQMPAYFMQCIAHSMHTYLDDENALEGIANYIDSDKTDKLEIIAKKFNFKIKGTIFKDEDGIWKIEFNGKRYNINQAIFKFTVFADEYKQAHTKLIDTSEYLEFPHYVESYYILTKKVLTVDFK